MWFGLLDIVLLQLRRQASSFLLQEVPWSMPNVKSPLMLQCTH